MADRELGRRQTIQEIGEAVGPEPLARFLHRVERKSNLSRRERLRIVDQAIMLLEMNYVHLPLKRAMHAIDPIQRLKLLKFRLEPHGREPTSRRHLLTRRPAMDVYTGMQFHQRILEIFASLRDLHTVYSLPEPYNSHTAFLPLLIEQYFEKRGKKLVEKFLLTRVVSEYLSWNLGPEWNEFQPGVEILYWNGIPIRRAIELNGETQAGSNPEARFARGLDNLTIRPLGMSLPPDEKWVEITYRTAKGRRATVTLEWKVYRPDVEIKPSKKRRAAIDIKKTKINQVKKQLFSSRTISTKRFADNFYFETKTIGGAEFGYLRLFDFGVKNNRAFVKEIKRIVTAKGFPQEGLIIDVRGNPGGNIRAGERMLQLFTPARIKPELFEFINTPLNLEICEHDKDYSQWAESIREAVVTGATYSMGFPLSSEDSCNDIGQVYYGPVVLITDALCYSATDMFVAGFQDNEVGIILGTSDNTGAGGANVWTYQELRSAVRQTSMALFKPLPRQADLTIAMRRSIRVGRCEGRPLEELGILPDRRHYMTRNDLLNQNEDLLAHAVHLLRGKPVYKLSAETVAPDSRALRIAASSRVNPRDGRKRIAHVDVFVDGRPEKTLTAQNGNVKSAMVFLDQVAARANWHVQAFDHDGKLVASARRQR
jgi:C-terminal processing protease CtpA/Prc